MEDLVTTIPLEMPRRPLTVADYVALPEDIDVRWELMEGNLVMSPKPAPLHNLFAARLRDHLERVAPPHLVVVPEVDVDLQLVPDADPATVRAPDVVVMSRAGFDRVASEGGLLRAAEVQLVVEVASPGSRRTDRIIKLGEYDDAGIPAYWIVDLDGGPSLIECRRVATGYTVAEPVVGTFATDVPFAVEFDLTALLAPPA